MKAPKKKILGKKKVNLKPIAASRCSVAPRASTKKKIFYFFHLIQPVLQFIAIVALLGVFARCSPLAPTTTKSLQDKNSNTLSQSNKVEDQIKSDLIASSLEEISLTKVEFLSTDDSQELLANSLNLSQVYTREQVSNFLHKYPRTKKNPKIALLSLSLDELEQTHLFQNFTLQLNLQEKLQQSLASDSEAIDGVYKILQSLKNDQKLSAKVIVSLDKDILKANKTGLENLTARIKTKLALIQTEQLITDSYLDLSYISTKNPIAQKRDAEALRSALDSAAVVSIVLE